MSRNQLHAIVRGRVQGVNFRWYTRERAVELDLTGWVRNLRGGRSVELVAQGRTESLRELIRFLHRGPPSARVDEVEVDWQQASGEFDKFEVLFL
jgi:acylphosphatase